MDTLNTLKHEIKVLIITALELEDLTPDDLLDEALLFGDDGIGLDSIDALELGVALRKKYQIQLEASSTENQKYFRSVNSLTELVHATKKSVTP